jgi:hypothetical protein
MAARVLNSHFRRAFRITLMRGELKKVWDQKERPVVLRRAKKGQRLRIRIPFSHDNFEWLKNGRRISPIWVNKFRCWELPKAWFNDLVERALVRYGWLYIVQPYREQEKCSPACLNASGYECQCSCMGAYHGAGNDGSWFEVSDTFATRWGDQQLACRLLTMKCLPRLWPKG